MFSLWLLVGIMSLFHRCSGDNSHLHAYSHGDIIIGGLFPLHLTTNRSTILRPISCSNYDISVFLHTQVMIYAITQINQQTQRLLAGLTLGYDIYDSCGDVSCAMKATLQMLNNQSQPENCQPALPEPQVKAVIGERFSEVSAAVARVVALSSVAQISYASTSEVLSNKFKFPTFLRTIPSDEYQTKAIVELVKNFKWKTVAIIGSNDEYGKYGSDSLEKLFNHNNICIEFISILPDDFCQSNSQTSNATHLNELVKRINESIAEAIIMFTKHTNVYIVMEVAIKYKLNRIWIASDSWSTSTTISEMKDLVLAGQVFGFISKRNEVPGFKNYVMSMFNGTTNAFLEDFLHRNICSNGFGERLNLTCVAKHIDQDKLYNTYVAVQVVLQGLRQLLECNKTHCQHRKNVTAAELLMEIKKVNFTVSNTHMFFDTNGDPSLGYDILYWNVTYNITNITVIGEYSPDEKIYTDMPDEDYNGWGHRKYSSSARCTCLKREEEFLQWLDPFSIILSSFGVLGIIVTIVIAALFTIYRSTPIVKAVGGYLCFLELFSLLTCFCLTFTFIGKPTKTSCMLGLPVFGIAFSLCISCILANLLQILVGFSFDLKLGSWLKKLNQPVVVVTFVSGIQLALCVLWMYHYPPLPDGNMLNDVNLQACGNGSNAFFIAMIGYNAFLALICFVFAFKGKRLPDLYKNASLISISMLVFLIVWVFFIQIYINMFWMYKPAIESLAILLSSYSMLCCHLAPKCYIMLFRKEINNENAIIEHIRKHYEQKGMTVVKP